MEKAFVGLGEVLRVLGRCYVADVDDSWLMWTGDSQVMMVQLIRIQQN